MGLEEQLGQPAPITDEMVDRTSSSSTRMPVSPNPNPARPPLSVSKSFSCKIYGITIFAYQNPIKNIPIFHCLRLHQFLNIILIEEKLGCISVGSKLSQTKA